MIKNLCKCLFCISIEEQPKTSSTRQRDYPWEIYSLKELVHATNNFHNENKIGEGGFGSVYWGRTSKGVEMMDKLASSIASFKSSSRIRVNSCEINELAKEAANPILDEQEKEQPNKPASSAASFTSSISHKIKDQFARIRPRVQKPKQVEKLVAVKRLKAMTAKAEMEFAVEVEILGRVRHKNLLGLRGFYAGGDERLIVYDYMPNHSLITHLHGQLAADCLLDWPRRLRIAIGSAEGLAYLHQEANPHIIHRDIKASNVLLDSEFHAKVADFGFAKLIPEGVTHLTTRVKGTLGYLAPEYAMWGKVSESCDVYSFGILLLEIISARKPLEKLQGGVKRDIVQWATPFLEKGAFDQIADPRLKGKFDLEELRRVIMISMRCTDTNPNNRPSMSDVVTWLKGGMGSRRQEIRIRKDNSDDEYDDDQEKEEEYGDYETDYEVFEVEKLRGKISRV